MIAKPLSIGPIELTVPVVLAPMAGITNTAFRRLCREYGAGLYVSEMITSRALVERTPESMRLIRHHESETPRSIQLYGVDPKTVREAVTMLVAEDRADHIDLNFGCPVPKVTRKGGGAALPWKLDLFRDIVEGAVKAAGDRPLTIKMRKGIDPDHLTYLEAGRIAEGAGVGSIALHARTASEFYSGHADWSAIAKLKETITDVPVLGNGDIWSAEDALRMVAETGCDGVVVGRGCLGKPWLFGDLAAAFQGGVLKAEPTLGEVARAYQRHAELLALGIEPVAYGEGLAARVNALAPGGIDAAIDTVGTDEALEVSLQFLTDPARFVTIVNFAAALAAGGQAIGSGPGADPGREVRAAARLDLAALLADGSIEVEIARTYPLAEAKAAYAFMVDGHAGGKVVLEP